MTLLFLIKITALAAWCLWYWCSQTISYSLNISLKKMPFREWCHLNINGTMILMVTVSLQKLHVFCTCIHSIRQQKVHSLGLIVMQKCSCAAACGRRAKEGGKVADMEACMQTYKLNSNRKSKINPNLLLMLWCRVRLKETNSRHSKNLHNQEQKQILYNINSICAKWILK